MDQNAHGNQICGNEKFIAVPWNAGSRGKDGPGGAVGVHSANDIVKFEDDIPLLIGHKESILDLCFSPFNDNILATGSGDATIKIWSVPNEGLEKDTHSEFDLLGHPDKVTHIKWHPSAEALLSSASLDGHVKIWDVEKQHSDLTYELDGKPWAMEWNYDGSLLGCLTEEKWLHIFDPRQTQ